jgi:carbonic anhydrase
VTEIIPVNYRSDILPEYRDTPVGLLLEYHNLERAAGAMRRRQILIGMCMDSRNALRMPRNFAYVLRTAGANMRDNEFRISYAISVLGVRTIVLIAHTDCGMKTVAAKHDQFISGMVEHAGGTAEQAEAVYAEGLPKFGISDEVEFVMGEAARLRALYPKIEVAPLLYELDDHLLYQLR